MTSQENVTRTYEKQPFFEQRDYAWMFATFVLTPLTAAALAVTGYITMNPFTAAVSGLLVSFLYVGFRVINAWRRFQLYTKALAKKSDEKITSD